VGNMPFSATEDMLEDFFAKYGDISSVKILQRVFA
jgi:RNA recognition motif-containing protein